MRGDGTVYRRGRRWWIAYSHRGERYFESAGRTQADARRKLRARQREIARDEFVGPPQEKILVDDLLDELLRHLEVRGARSLRAIGYHMRPVRAAMGSLTLPEITTARVEDYMRARLALGRARATVNHEVESLKRAFNLARKRGTIVRVPYLPRLSVSNVRQGFFEADEFWSVVAFLPEAIADIARFSFITGWRLGEILALRWDQIDRRAETVSLPTSKNTDPRVLAYGGLLKALIERRWRRRLVRYSSGELLISQYVFHRFGRPWRDITRPWKKACDAAGVRGRLFHDLRRTAARNMIQAGVREHIVMQIMGHKTRSMFLRYQITTPDDQRRALVRTDRHLATVVRMRRKRRSRKEV